MYNKTVMYSFTKHFRKRTVSGTSPLFNAIHDDDDDAIILIDFLFLATDASINDTIDTINNTALHLATVMDRKEIVLYLLSKSADVNLKNDDGDTPLHIAIKTSNIPIAQILLDNGSDLNSTNRLGLTCFMSSIQFSNSDMLHFLVKNGKDISKCSELPANSIIRPLECAVNALRVEAVQLLIDNGADVNQFGKVTKGSPLHDICMRLMDSRSTNTNEDKLKVKKITQCLIKAGVDLNARDEDHLTPLHLAIKSNDIHLVELLVKYGSDLNIPAPPEELSRTPLQLMMLNSKSKKLIDLFLRYGADYLKHDGWGLTAYHYAITESTTTNIQVVQLFWKYGCSYDLPMAINHMPTLKGYGKHYEHVVRCQEMLFEGLKTNNVKTVEKALTLGAIVRGTSMKIKYPLHFMCCKGYTDVAKIFLEKGVKVNNLNDEKKTPLQLAIKHKQIKMCKLLFQHGAYCNYKEEIKKLDTIDDKIIKEIKYLLMSIHLWFSLIKEGNYVIFETMKDLLETDEKMFLVHLNALDKNKRSIMASALYYGHGTIVEEIMKNRLIYKKKLLGLK